MAEGCSGGGSWWNSWIETAKEKSSVALDFVKKDLSEFTSTVQSDSQKVLTNVKENLTQDNVTAATQKAKAGVNSFLGGITKVLTVEAEDKNIPRTSKTASQPIFDRAKARLNAIQVDQGTYINEPSGSEEEFKSWLEGFHLDNHKGEISELLVMNVEVRSLYTQLVPSMVSHADFWHRYFYKLHQLDQDEARRAALKKRAEDSSTNIGWDDSEDDTDDWVDMSGPSSPPQESHMIMHDMHSAAHTNIPADTQQNIHTESEDKTHTQKIEQNISAVTDTVMDRGLDQPEGRLSTPEKITKSDAVKHETENDRVQATETVAIDSIPAETGKLSLESSSETLVSSQTESKYPNVPEIKESHDTSSEDSIVVVKSEESLEEKPVETREKGDLVVVGSSVNSDRTTPSSNSSNKGMFDCFGWCVANYFNRVESGLSSLLTRFGIK